MQFRRTIVFAISALSVAAGAFMHRGVAAERPARTSTTNPLRDQRLVGGVPVGTRDELMGQLKVDLKGRDKARAIIAIHRLEEFGADGAALLAQTLVADDLPMEIQFPTLNALVAIGPPAVPAILDLLQSPHAAAHEAAWQVLFRLGPRASAASPMMLNIVCDGAAGAEDRELAVHVLETIGPAARVSPDALLETAERADEPSQLRAACLRALRAVGSTTADHHEKIATLLANENEEPGLRIAAAAILIEQPSPSPVVLPALIGLLQQRDYWEVCIRACEAIGKLGPDAASEAVPALSGLLEHPGNEVRLAAVAACGVMGPSAAEAVPNLLRRIESDEDPGVAEAAAQALVKIDSTALSKLLTGFSRNDALREPVLKILPAIGPAGKPAIPDLLQMLGDTVSADLHEQVIDSLGSMGSEATAAVPILTSFLANRSQPVEIRAAAAVALAAISDESVPQLLTALRNDEPAIRIAAAHALGIYNTRDRTAVPALLRELSDPKTADAAAAALLAIGQEAAPAVAKLALDPAASAEQRCVACLVLGRLGGTTAPILARLLKDSEGEIAEAVRQALLDIGPKEAMPALLDAIQEYELSGVNTRPGMLDRDAPPAGAVRTLELIVEMSGGMGGPARSAGGGGGSTFSAVGSALDPGPSAAAPPSIPAADVPEIGTEMPSNETQMGEAQAREAMKRAEDAEAKARWDGAKANATNVLREEHAPSASDPATAGDAAAAVPPASDNLKVVKVFYGTNRQPLAATADRLRFLWHGILPSILVGSITIVVCAIGFFRSRSPFTAALAVFGVLATVFLTVVALQKTTESARAITRRPGPVYGGDHSDELQLGTCEVSIPADHQAGELESPSVMKLEFDQDPYEHITLREVIRVEEDMFHKQLQQRMAAKGNNILVFVHGYNVEFDDAARRTAQLASDLEFAGAPIFFSWPSQGNWYQYRQDEKQVELAVPLLKKFLLDVAVRSHADSIHLIAHSMGNRALTTALKEIAAATDQTTQFNQVVLAAPDIDADIFRQRIAPEIVTKARRVTLYASSNDLALAASRTFNSGDLRAGDASRGLVLTPGIETIDASSVDTSLLGHSYYGDSPTVLTDLKELLKSANPADQRPYLQPMALNRLRYWVFQSPEIARGGGGQTR